MCRFPLTAIQSVLEKTVSAHLGKIEFPFKRASLMRLNAVKKNKKTATDSVRVCIN